MMIGDFELVLLYDADQDHAISQIRYNDFVICNVLAGKGYGSAIVEVLCNDEIYFGSQIEFPFDDFIRALNVAKNEVFLK